MFQRKRTTSPVFPKEKTVGWLTWLAKRMREHSQSVFLVEGLQPSWLGKKAKRVVYGTFVALSLGLVFGLIASLVSLGNVLAGFGESGSSFDVGLSILVGVALGCWSESPWKNGLIS